VSTRAVLLSIAVAGIAASGVVIAQCRKKPRSIATLVEIKKGTAERSTDGGKGWGPASVGDRFARGHAVRTSADGNALLEFGGGMVLRLGASTTIVFGKVLSIVGEVTNESDKELVLMLDEGISRIGPRSTVRFSVGDRGERQIVLVVGEATFENLDGNVASLERGAVLVVTESTSDPEIDAGATAAADAAPPIDALVVATGAISVAVTGRITATEPDREAQNLKTGEHSLAAGTRLSVRRGSSVEIRRGGEVAVVKGAADAVIGGENGALVVADSGTIRVSAPDSNTLIKVPGGAVMTRQGRGRAEIAISRAKTKITARSGVIDVTGGGARESIKIGEWIQLSRRGAMQVYGRQPRFADFAIGVGESAAIHDPGAPTAVRIRFGDKCAGEGGVVEYGSRRSRRIAGGDGSSIVLLKPGRHRYELKCLADGVPGKSVASGTLRVDRSSGARPLPLKPANNSVDADGLSYRIKYQNLVPNIAFRWPDAAAGRYKLMVKAQGANARAYATSGPQHTLKSGTLGEGTYRFWFEGNGSRSKEGVIIIGFDNASTSGYLRTPRLGGKWGGAMIDVAGAGIKGSRVSVGGSPLPLDHQYRFNAKVNQPGSQAALAVKFAHPLRGVHYYVRRDGRR
jgi:hypothetical protein